MAYDLDFHGDRDGRPTTRRDDSRFIGPLPRRPLPPGRELPWTDGDGRRPRDRRARSRPVRSGGEYRVRHEDIMRALRASTDALVDQMPPGVHFQFMEADRGQATQVCMVRDNSNGKVVACGEGRDRAMARLAACRDLRDERRKGVTLSPSMTPTAAAEPDGEEAQPGPHDEP